MAKSSSLWTGTGELGDPREAKGGKGRDVQWRATSLGNHWARVNMGMIEDRGSPRKFRLDSQALASITSSSLVVPLAYL